MKILVISYYFPPFGGGAVARMHGFTKYLPGFGIQPFILTVKPHYYEDAYHDQDLSSHFHEVTQIHQGDIFFGKLLRNVKTAMLPIQLREADSANFSFRIKMFLKMLLTPDGQILWIPNAVRAGKKLLKKEKIDVILATAPPFSVHILASLLARQSNTPLVLDYRDLWHSAEFPHTGNRNLISKYLEIFTSRQADKIIVTTHESKNTLEKSLNCLPEKIEVIENGYDGELLPAKPRFKTTNKFRIRHIGTISEYRTPEYFLTALKTFHTKHPSISLEVSFIGHSILPVEMMIANTQLEDIAKVYNAVPKKESLELMIESEILLLFQRKREGGGTAIPGKLYEYLAAGVPVLAMDEGEDGATTNLLHTLNSGFICNYKDTNGIVKALENIVFNYSSAVENAKQTQRKISSFSRETQTQKLSQILSDIVKDSHS